MTNTEIIAVVQAAEAGKIIEVTSKIDRAWTVMSKPHYWNFCAFDYRVKPEPLEFWVNVYDRFVGQVFTSEQDAITQCLDGAKRTAVHFREVIE